MALYVMDDWKVTPKLTINLGLRWEIIPPLYEVTNRMSEVSLSVPDPGAGDRPGALIFGGPFNDTYWKEFGPRFGIAYKVTDNMVIRAGYAMTNTPPIANSFGYTFTFGYSTTVNVQALANPHNPAHLPEPTVPQPRQPSAQHRSFFRGGQSGFHHGARREPAGIRAELRLHDSISVAR